MITELDCSVGHLNPCPMQAIRTSLRWVAAGNGRPQGNVFEADGLDTCRRRGFETLPPCAASRPPCSGEVEQFTLSDAKVASGNQRAVVEFERHSAGAEDHEEGCSCDPCPGAVPRLSCHVVAPNAEGSVQVRAVWTINIEAMRREADPLRTTP